jgi:hypothetical protein
MTAPTGTENAPEGAEGGTAEGESKAAEQQSEKDWKAEFEAQQRINRDIERRNGKRLKELEAELATAKAAKPAAEGDKKPEIDIDALRKQIRDEAAADSLRDRALDKIEAKAARLLANPEDARVFLASKLDDFIGAGTVDVNAISDALADLIKARPYLGVTQGDSKRFKGTADGGAKGNAGKPQLTKADLKSMTPDAILSAKAEGRMNNLLGIT